MMEQRVRPASRTRPRRAVGLLDRPVNAARVGVCLHSNSRPPWPPQPTASAATWRRSGGARPTPCAPTSRTSEACWAYAAAEGVTDLDGLELGTLRRWLGSQSEAGKSRATLARRSATARAFTAWAVREELIAADPALRLKAPKREKSLPGVLHQQQVLRLVEGAESAAAEGGPLALRNRAMVELLYATGIRVGELAGMDVDDLDPDRRTLRVLGKGNKERTVPYGVPAALAVDDWLRRGRPALATGTSGPALFLGARGNRVDQRQVRSVVKDMLDGAGGHRRDRAARPAALGRHPSARRRGGPAGGAGNPGPQQPGDHADLHPRLGRAAPAELPAGPSAGLNRGLY